MKSIAAIYIAALVSISCVGSTYADSDRDGSHDFDFEFGAWSARIARLEEPLSGKNVWVEYTGTSIVHPWWDGKANIGELRISGSSGSIEGMSIRLYDPASRQWAISWANTNSGQPDAPMVGGFNEEGIGLFYNKEIFNNREVDVRFIFSEIAQDSFKLEQAFSPDAGTTWEPNWIAEFERERAEAPLNEAPIRAVWTELDRAWNARDVDGFSALYTEDASFIFVGRGHTMTGRTAIHEHFSVQFPRTASGYSHHATISDMRTLAPGIMSVDGVVEVHNNGAPYSRFAIYGVMKSVDGDWRIDALRVYELPLAE